MGKRRKFSSEFKTQIILQLISGEQTQAELCRVHQINSQQLGNWRKQFLENASKAFGSSEASGESEVAELERMIGKLTMQLEIAKKASKLLSFPVNGNGR